jgi:hypothetical protein
MGVALIVRVGLACKRAKLLSFGAKTIKSFLRFMCEKLGLKKSENGGTGKVMHARYKF